MTTTSPPIDAFVDEASDREAEERFNRAHPVGPEADARAATEGDAQPDALSMPAALQDLKISAKSNGNNYLLTFEVGIENIADLAEHTESGYDVHWRKYRIGAGGQISRMSVTRDADGAAHLKIVLLFSESEVASAGKIAPMVGASGTLSLTPMQLSLDLTSRAE